MASLTLSIPWDHFTDKDLTLGVTSLERMTGVGLDLGIALALQDTISMNHKTRLPQLPKCCVLFCI
jgi:hypothetical protein